MDSHKNFVNRLALRQEISVPIFCLNYDGLIELSADAAKIRVVDGFIGLESPFFNAQVFQEMFGVTHRGPRKPQIDWKSGIIHLYKLHGSLGWFQLNANDVRKLGLETSTSGGAKRLMVPPQHRKGTETTAPPYASLWSDFRKWLCHGPILLNRLVAIGYGLRDEHLNAIIENALARTNFTLLVFACDLSQEVFSRWSLKRNVVLVTKNQCSLNGEIGPGHPNLWDFQELSMRV
jgi:hypothetical protein